MPDRRNDIVGLFRRDLDRIELPPRDSWRPAPRKASYLMKTSRFVLYVGAVAAMLVAALIVGFGLRDRNSQVATSPGPVPATSTPLPNTTPEGPVLLLKVPTGSGDAPGVVPAAPGGISARGPQSVAVEGGKVFLWDEAALRVLVYTNQALTQKAPLTAARASAAALLVEADRLYLRDQDDSGKALVEDEFAIATGSRLRSAQLQSGDSSIYPRVRLGPTVVTNLAKGTPDPLGEDRSGNRYERLVPASSCGACTEFRRLDKSGAVLGSIVITTDTRFEDLSVSSDGGIYGLSWDRDGGNQISGVSVWTILAPTTAPTATTPTRTTTPPSAGFFKFPCGTVTAYVAPSATAAGSVALGTASFALAAGSGPITNAPPTVGSSICVNGDRSAEGVFTQFSISPMGEGICSTVLAYTPASATTPGTLDFGTPRPPVRIPVANGVTFTPAQVSGDQCFRVVPDAGGTAQVTAYIGPRQ